MGTHILTLFGEEIIPEQLDAVGKRRSTPKKKKEKVQEQVEAETAVAVVEDIQEEAPAGPDILKGWDGDKKYYTIGEVAKLFKVRTSNIRYWTKEFSLKVRTTRKGDRLYTPEQVKEIRTIYHLVKERGFTINGAKTHLKNNKKAAVESVDLKQSLLQLRNKLVDLKNSIK
ncbi:MAG: MerR family transcriptional regulator [Chitinophagales bacterium]|nr:MerR family transcriptional regulator [Chitinophagaceae bacterium]MCB9063964.1 MerR family transcriptional regulator [Chitinophagales bacterium]